MKCKICDLECKSFPTLFSHLKRQHNLTSQEYYDKFFKKENEEFCNNPNCNNRVKYLGITLGYRKYCSCSCSMSDPENKKQHKLTCLAKYGVENPSQVKEIQNKKQQTFLKKYGRTCNLGDPENRKLQDATRRAKNNGEYHSIEAREKFRNNLKNREKIIATNIKNHGYANPFQWPEIKEKIANTHQYKHINCSRAENEIYEWICKCYNKTVIHNDRKVLQGKELDIYLPDLNLAFEYDGRYWHADPSLYKATDIIDGRTAEEIWKNDKLKDDTCKKLGLSLIRIKEQDYLQNKNNILYFIMLLLEVL